MVAYVGVLVLKSQQWYCNEIKR